LVLLVQVALELAATVAIRPSVHTSPPTEVQAAERRSRVLQLSVSLVVLVALAVRVVRPLPALQVAMALVTAA
jgi:hypothetical protein